MAYKQLKLWFDKDLAKMLAKKIEVEYADFPSKKFVKNIDKGVSDLELKDRVEFIADQLHQSLPSDYLSALQILIEILGPENEAETGMFKVGYWIMPIAKYVEKYGLDHFKASMDAIREITKRNTGEYAIRPYLERYPKATMKLVMKWSKDKNFHVRRLASEGIRSRLPWAKKINLFVVNPMPVIAVLENLKNDPIKYVQKSVANNLNDILKDNYPIGIKVIKKWAKDATPSCQWIIKHALRNELKKANPEALEILNN